MHFLYTKVPCTVQLKLQENSYHLYPLQLFFTTAANFTTVSSTDNDFHNNLFTKIVLVVDSLKLSNEPEDLSSTSEPELTLSYYLP